MTSLNRLVKDLSKLEAELSRFETRVGVKSQEFYEAMMRGDLEEFDALDNYRMEFIEWLALYKTWLSLDEKYGQEIARPVAHGQYEGLARYGNHLLGAGEVHLEYQLHRPQLHPRDALSWPADLRHNLHLLYSHNTGRFPHPVPFPGPRN